MNYLRPSSHQRSASKTNHRTSRPRRSSSAGSAIPRPSGSVNPGRTPCTSMKSASSHLKPGSSCSKQLFRSKSNLCTPQGCSAILSLSTPQLRIENKSPQRLKMFYSNLDERLHVSRIVQFVIENGDQFQVARSTTINDFIGITQLFNSVLMSPSNPVITNKNYKTEIPKMMQVLRYPIPVAQSFLKTPNTSQNFHHVLSMWTFLMDLVDVYNTPWEGPQGAAEIVFNLHNSLDSTERNVQIETAVLERNGLTTETYQNMRVHLSTELEKLSKQMDKRKLEIETRGHQLQIKNEQYKVLVRQREELAHKIHEAKVATERAQEQNAYLVTRLARTQATEAEKRIKLQSVKHKTEKFTYTLADVENLDKQIEINRHRLTLLRKRNEELLAMQRTEHDARQEMEIQALTLIMEYNTQILKSGLPESVKRSLKLNEAKINVAQVEPVKALVAKLQQQAAMGKQEYSVMQHEETGKLWAAEKQLAEAMMESEERQRLAAENKERVSKLNANAVMLLRLQKDEDRKMETMEKAIVKAVEKRKFGLEVAQKHRTDTDACLKQMKFYTEKMVSCRNEKASEIIAEETKMLNNVAAATDEVNQFLEQLKLTSVEN